MAETETVRRAGIWSVRILAALSVIAAVVLARSFLMPVILAFLLSLTFSPIRRWAERRGVASSLTSLVLVLSLLVGVGAVVLTLSGPVSSYAENSGSLAIEIERKLRGVSSALEKVADASEQVEKIAQGGEPAPGEVEPQKVVMQGPSLVTRFATTAPTVVGQVLFTLVLLFFLVASGDMFYEKIVQVAPTLTDKKRALGIAYDIERKLSRYFLTITAINAGLGVAVGIALWLLGMPNPALFGVAAFLLNFIPFIGAMIGVLATVAIGIVQFDTLGQALAAGGVFLALTAIEGQFVTPYAVGRSLQLNPVLVFLAVAFWGWAWSVIGMFVAVPVLIATRVFCEKVPQLENLGIFLSDRAPQRPD